MLISDKKVSTFSIAQLTALVNWAWAFKTYIKTKSNNGFTWYSKLSTCDAIYLVIKYDTRLRLFVKYWGLDNLMIKNWYPLP